MERREIPLSQIYNKISIQQYKTDMGFKALVEGVHDNLFVIPEYQRKYRWSKKQVEELAVSLIRDLPIPPIYTFRNENGQLEILDGQQRIMSLYFYYIGKFFRNSKKSVFDYRDLDIENSINFETALEEKYHNIVPTRFFMELNEGRCDISYASLPVEIKRKIDYRTISIIEIKIADERDLELTLHKIFTNLNNGGEGLSDQELRNGIYPCKFSRMINEMNKNNSVWRILNGPVKNKCEDMELLYRFCALKKFVEYDGKNFKISEYHNSMKDLLDDFSEQAFRFTDKEILQYKKSLEGFINSLLISKIYFKKLSVVEGLFIILEKTNLTMPFNDEICEKILDDPIVEKTTSGGTISQKNRNKRWRRIYEILSEYDK